MTTETHTLAVLKQRCIDRDAAHVDQVVNLTSLSMDANKPGILLVKRGPDAPTNEYPFDDHVYKLLPRVLPNLPSGYLEKCVKKAPDLAARNFNYWVEDTGDKGVRLRYRQGDGKGGSDDRTIRAVLPENWQPLNYGTAIGKMIDRFGPDQLANLTTLSETQLVLDIIYGKLGKEAVVGDIVSWGARYRDSDVGFGKLVMAGFTNRLRCTNGAVHSRDGVGVNLAHTDKLFDEPAMVYGMLVTGIDSVQNYANFISEAQVKAHAIKLDEPSETRLRINDRFNVTKLEDEHVAEGWNMEAELDPTAYRLMQAYTRAANSRELPVESKFRLQSVGGNILNLATQNYRFN